MIFKCEFVIRKLWLCPI